MKVAIYCRVSTNEQSCFRQKRDLIDFAQKECHEIMGIWSETVSGISLKRTERNKVMALAKRKEIDAVMVTELSRWGRNTSDLLNTLHELNTWGVKFICLTGQQFDLSTPEGLAVAKMMASFVQFEREMTQERVRSGLVLAKARGKQLGRRKGNRPKSDKLAPEVLSMVKKGYSYRHIAVKLKISKTTIVDIIKRSRLSDVTLTGKAFNPTQLTLGFL